MIPVIAHDSVLDGVTSVGDIDVDGELDVVVVRGINDFDNGGIWVWNPRTRTVIASAPSGFEGGIPFVGDVDGDCAPEIGMTFEKQLRMYKYNGTSSLQLLYNLPTTDESGFTGITMFDFNQDGKNELVYRDETDLRIIAGIDGSTIALHPLQSGTGLEYPVVADVDHDGEAEIIVNGYLTDPAQQRVFCFESGGSRWAPARNVWNQPGYSITNVNDDLTIPRYPQHPAKPLPGYEHCLLDTCATPYNSFNVQATYRTQAGCVLFPSHDLSVDLLSYTCKPDSVTLCLSVSNSASLAIHDEIVPIAGWRSNPLLFNSSPVFSFQQSLNLKKSEVDSFCFTFPLPENLDSIFIALNDPGSITTPYTFPLTSLQECNYNNNIDVIHMDLRKRILDLGPDIIKCESEVITLYAGPDFISYSWSDNSNDSIYSSGFEGKHYVDATDQCGRIYTDTVNFYIESSRDINLGNDTITCAGKLLSYQLSDPYDWIKWLPTQIVDCDTCAAIELTTDTSLYLIVIAGTGNCIYQDSVAIDVAQPFIVDTSHKMCSGDTLLFHEMNFTSSGQHTIEVGTCDTLYNLSIEVSLPDSVFLATQLCSNDSIWFNDSWLKSPGQYLDRLINTVGCDSIVQLELSFIDPLSHSESLQACEGDSISIFNQWIYSTAIVHDTITSSQGCDSVLTAEITFSPYEFHIDSIAICKGDSIFLNDKWVLAAGPYIDTITATPCDIIQLTELEVYPESIKSENYVLCPGDSIELAHEWIKTEGSRTDTLQNSYGCDSIRHTHIQLSFTENLPLLSDTIVIANESLLLELPLPANEWNVDWFPPGLFSCSNCLTTSLNVSHDVSAHVHLTNKDGCEYLDTFMVYVAETVSDFFIANIFSPNGDGQNDTRSIFFDPSKGSIETLQIFDRWGNMVHNDSSKNGELNWDGTNNGKKLSSGVYAYKLTFKTQNEPLRIITGNLTLIR